jgi:hypothetical protein
VKRTISFAIASASTAAATTAALWLAVPAGAAAGPAASGTEHFQIVSTSANSSTASVIATGVFTAGGADHMGNKVDTFVFSNGSFKVAHAGPMRQSVNPKTCLLRVTGHGTYKISGGTGSYAKISGSGTYKLSVMAVLAKSAGKCSMRKAPLASQEIVNASGPVRL